MKRQKRLWALVLSLCLFASWGMTGFVVRAAETEKAVESTEAVEKEPIPLLTDVRKAPVKKGKWVKKGTHYLYRLKNGTYAKDQWLKIKKKIYYFNDKGYRVKGWHTYLGKKYYAATNGTMVTGWKRFGTRRYYFKKNGIMAANEWVKSKGRYYYFTAKGKMAKGWLTLGEKKYYLDSDGVRVTGDYFIKNKGYHFSRAGVYEPDKKVTSKVNPNKPMVALTFDDGPGPYTERLLKCLKKNRAAATFFLVGSSVGNYKSTVKKAYQMGCEIGNHSWNHPQLTTLGSDALYAQINNTNRVIKSATGHNPTLLRPPYGSYNSNVGAAAGMPMILWDVDTLDWKTRNVQSTVQSVMSTAKDGSIVLMHDIHLPSVMAAEILIPKLMKKGYQLVTVSELAKYKKKRLHDGSAYSFIR